jgi:hypothetical protein
MINKFSNNNINSRDRVSFLMKRVSFKNKKDIITGYVFMRFREMIYV